MHQLLSRRRAATLTLLAALLLLAGGLLPARPAPAVLAAPREQVGVPPEFLAASPDLTGLMDNVTSWTVGGGYLYWGSCSGATTDPGYLRRWPLGGGRAATLSSDSFCPTQLAADASGLYALSSSGDGWQIVRRSLADPLTPVRVVSRQAAIAGFVLEGDSIAMLADSVVSGYYVTRAPKRTVDAGGTLLAYAGTRVSSLLLSGGIFSWFGDGQLRQMAQSCAAESCVLNVAPAAGTALTGATLSSLSAQTTPLWVDGQSMTGYRCASAGGGCAVTTPYTAPSSDADPNNSFRFTPLRFASDGASLFWVERHERFSAGDTTTPAGYLTTDEGRLMRWPLRQVGVGGPPPVPEPIACKGCFADYGINGGSVLGLARGDDARATIAVADGWVYFMTTRGISRIRADAPPVRWDLAVGGLEVTQGIQSLANDVPLVADKPTAVRLFGRRLSGPNAARVEARLFGSVGGVALPGSPLAPLNGGHSFTTPGEGFNRADPDGGWIFILPPAWVQTGELELRAQIDPRQLFRDPNPANNSSGIQRVGFTRKAPVCLVFVPVRTNPGVRMFTPAHWFAISMVTRLLPTPDVWVYQQSEDIAELQARVGIPPWEFGPYEPADDGSKMILALWLRDQLSDDPARCNQAGARTHYVGVVSAQAGGVNGQGRVGGDQLWFRLPPDDFTADWRTDRAVTLAHELGHNYGLDHVNCGNPDGPGPYPYPPCQLDDDDAITRHYGLTRSPRTGAFEVILPTQAGDLMSYAHRLDPPLPRWVSDATWRSMVGGLASLAAAPPAHVAELAAAGAVVLVGGAIDPANPAQATLEHAWIFPAASASPPLLAKWGQIAASEVVAEGRLAAGSYHLRLRDAAGALLDDRAVQLADLGDERSGAAPFQLSLPAPTGSVARIELLDGETVLVARQIGPSAPSVSVRTPAGGEQFTQRMTLSWRASDPDPGDRLLFTVQYSPDGGQTWRALLTNLPNLGPDDTMSVDLRDLSGLPASVGANGLIRVAASDGYHTSLAVSQPFHVSDRAPQPAILAPAPLSTFAAGGAIALAGAAMDAEDGALAGTALTWTVDGAPAGVGADVSVAGLAQGEHEAILTATDSAGQTRSVRTSFAIEPLAIPSAVTPNLDGECNDDAYATAAVVALQPSADGSQARAQLLRDAEGLWVCVSGLTRSAGAVVGGVVVRLDPDLNRGDSLAVDDRELRLGEDGLPATRRGAGASWETITSGGFAGQVSADGQSWSAELRIDAATVGGWVRLIGLAIVHETGDGAAHAWPYAARRPARPAGQLPSLAIFPGSPG